MGEKNVDDGIERRLLALVETYRRDLEAFRGSAEAAGDGTVDATFLRT